MLPPLAQQVWPAADDTVAVLVPSYNHVRYIERTLRSILAQTHQPTNLLVIDDGSKDGSPEIIERVLNDASFPTELIARPNRGLSATLNEGFGLLTPASYFAYLGSDDVWLADFLEKRIALLTSRPTGVLAYGHAYSVDADDRIIDCSREWAPYIDGDARPMLLEGTAPLSPTVVYRRAAIEDLTWNENSRLEDYEFYLRLSTKGDFAYDPQILSGWRQHGANTSEGSLMMMEEKISALYRTAPLFELSDSELDRLIRLAHFRGAQELMRRGHRSLAMKHGLPRLSAAKSPREIIRFLGGLTLPLGMIESHRAKARDISNAQYGRLDLRKDKSSNVGS